MSLQIANGNIDEIKALIESGDVKLDEYRNKFLNAQGRDTILTEENLIRAIAATDDDDDDLFVLNALEAEEEQKSAAPAE